MTDDFANYQSRETCWRYESRVQRLEREITNTELLLRAKREELGRLKNNPPLRHLFNWSA